MAKVFSTVPKIELHVALSHDELVALEQHAGRFFEILRVGVYLLDVETAEKAVAWLKAHGVEREP